MIVDHSNADERDNAYLACQLRTNHAVVKYKAQMQQALSVLHQHYLEVSEVAELDKPPSVDIIVPRLDTVSSRPRSATPSPAEAEELTRQLSAIRAVAR
jgi:hypothetical protein